MSDKREKREKGLIGGIFDLTRYSGVSGSLIAILFGLLVGFVVLLISNPADAVPGFGKLAFSAFANMKDAGQVLYSATPIIMTGLAVAFAGKTGLFNIGASGQFIVGAYVAILIGVKVQLPGVLLCVVCIAAAIAAGALWGAIPGLLKAYRNVNEVISCIMMNYIGMYLVNWLVTKTVYDKLRNLSQRVQPNANLPKLGLDEIFKQGYVSSSVNAGIFVAIIAAVVVWVVLEKTTLGFELKACGYNKDAAKYAGVNANRGIVTAMAISGALAGLGGALLYLSGAGKGIDVVDTLAAEGFNGIPVALLALNNPIGVIFAGLFVAYLGVGGFNLQLYRYAPQVVDMIVAIIIYFSAFSLLVKGFIQKVFTQNAVSRNKIRGKTNGGKTAKGGAGS